MENEIRDIHPFDLFFGAGPALMHIFKLGFRPKREDMFELTEMQYEQYYKQNGHTEEKIYALLPYDSKELMSVSDEPATVMVLTDSDIDALRRGWQIVENICSKAEHIKLRSDEMKLQYAASVLPQVFTEGTRFEGFAKGNIRAVYMRDTQEGMDVNIR